MKETAFEIHGFPVVAQVRSKEGKRALNRKKLSFFAGTLANLLEGGVPILKALEGLEKATADRELGSLLSEIHEKISRGAGLSEALEKTGRVPALFHETVYAGEVSGSVPVVLNELGRYFEKEETLKRGIRDALVYPAFILLVGLVTIGVLTCYVLPKLEGVYEGFGTQLPLITTVIMALAKLFPVFMLAGFVAGAAAVFIFRKKGFSEKDLFRLPFIGDFAKGFIRVRFSRLLSLLLESGVPMLQAMRILERTFGDGPVRRDVISIKESLSQGGGFSRCLDRLDWMDSISRALVVSAEETGRLGVSFLQIARDTEKDLEARIHLVLKLLEPTLILFIGLSVGFVVIGTVLPIFDMSEIVR